MSNPAYSDIETWDTAVELKGVSKTFRQMQRTGTSKDMIKNFFRPQTLEKHALSGVSFTIRRGEFVAYAGPNGAGKSTTIKLACGMLAPEKGGELRTLGLDPLKSRIALMKRTGILFGNRTELWYDQPVSASFEWKRVIWDIDKERFKRMHDMAVELLDIGGILSTFARELSLGQRMRADLALMLLHEPELILLDEPTLGLDVLAKRQMIGCLKELNRLKNTTIIVTSHDMDDLEEMAERIMLISHGTIAFDGSFDKLRGDIGVRRVLSVTTSGMTAPSIPRLEFVSSEGNKHIFSYDADNIELKGILSELAILPDVVDIELGRQSLEEMIANLYLKWKSD